ncbi:peptidylprolyl isomerase [Burkholderia multivorans]|uniref:peptidylprolyl isomerase n=1 Tax=Burkholderia multivorans TaxID=87883 RepID=UPI0021C05979|nr:peptidylprolyl isomerase [Burkholderia multivorans]MDR8758737.1 Foldase protein PrsA [Burkholderia multivorans]MDR8768419.1 Foldase protein PrsA [Burkholderia multivorans]MDR8771971.1 Foldase protein PrsA [Burkholderia multivorans]MDR8792305.1 Foldase protein PrsA [Burkholderia multivorans]MDR8797810.1 Foldase protein PrsA [Burkholderia multivorans]
MNDVLSEAATAPLVVNGIAIGDDAIAAETEHHGDARDALDAARHALAVRELLRQRAVSLALLDEGAPLDDAALDALLARELTHVPEPDRADCERYYAQHPARFRRNDIVYASHVLFAVTDRVPLAPLRQRAERALADVVAAPDTFDAVARASSNCPSAQLGGSLGQLLRGDTVPEFEAALFDTDGLGVLPKLVNTRFGFHIVRIDHRVPGDTVPFDAVAAQIAAHLTARVRQRAMRQYVAILAGGARIEGVRFDGANGPLVQ